MAGNDFQVIFLKVSRSLPVGESGKGFPGKGNRVRTDKCDTHLHQMCSKEHQLPADFGCSSVSRPLRKVHVLMLMSVPK